jgi:hypothetical protein
VTKEQALRIYADLEQGDGDQERKDDADFLVRQLARPNTV